jgi:primosomal protein N' (replication factor Y)
LVRIIIRSLDQEAAGQFADRLAGAFRVALDKETRRTDSPAPLRLLGPAEAPVFRLNGYYRFHFQLQSPSAAQLHRVLRDVLAVVRPSAGVDFQIDVDPFNML